MDQTGTSRLRARSATKSRSSGRAAREERGGRVQQADAPGSGDRVVTARGGGGAEEELTQRNTFQSVDTMLTPESPFPALIDYWLQAVLDPDRWH